LDRLAAVSAARLTEKEVDDNFEAMRSRLDKAAFDGVEFPKLLYHYCSTEAAQAIVSSGRMRATDIRYLNDPQEWRHGNSLAVAELQARIKARAPGDDLDLLQELKRDVDWRSERRENFVVMVASFCVDPDAPELWARYGKSGYGCSLTIMREPIPDRPLPGGVAVALVRYKAAEKGALVRRAVQEHLDLAKRLLPSAAKALHVRQRCSVSLQVHVGLLTTNMKQGKHRPERECRLVEMKDRGSAEVRYRTTPEGWLAPYYEIDVSAAIAGVRLGSKHPAGAEADWKEWLRRQGKSGVEVSRSQAP
jgi:hypothetical protein